MTQAHTRSSVLTALRLGPATLAVHTGDIDWDRLDEVVTGAVDAKGLFREADHPRDLRGRWTEAVRAMRRSPNPHPVTTNLDDALYRDNGRRPSNPMPSAEAVGKYGHLPFDELLTMARDRGLIQSDEVHQTDAADLIYRLHAADSPDKPQTKASAVAAVIGAMLSDSATDPAAGYAAVATVHRWASGRGEVPDDARADARDILSCWQTKVAKPDAKPEGEAPADPPTGGAEPPAPGDGAKTSSSSAGKPSDPKGGKTATLDDLPKIATAAPGSTPVGAKAYMASADGDIDAWLADGADGQTAGFLRTSEDPGNAVTISDATAWAQVVDSIGLIEQAVPTEDPMSEDTGKDKVEDGPKGEGGKDGTAPADATDQEPSTSGGAKETKAAKPSKDKDGDDDSGDPEEDAEHTGIMVALIIPPGEAVDLALDGPDAEPAEDLHITLAYLGDVATVEDPNRFTTTVLEVIHDIAVKYDLIEGQIGGYGRFYGADKDPVVLLYDAPELPEIRQAIVEGLAMQGLPVAKDHGFTPHITLAYIPDGQDTPLNRSEPRPLAFDTITFCFGDARLTTRLGAKVTADDAIPLPSSMLLPDSTAPSAQDPWLNGLNGKASLPSIASGSFVSWKGGKGRVSKVVTSGKVPGSVVEGSKDSPAALITIYESSGGGWKATSRKAAAKVATLQRIPPLTSSKSATAELVRMVAAYAASAPAGRQVAPANVRTVYERGLESWPGETKCAVSQEDWALGRTAAFLDRCAGKRIPGYVGDTDLMPSSPAETKAATPPSGEILSATEVDDVLASLRI
jgi:2'-5' RNA ligase